MYHTNLHRVHTKKRPPTNDLAGFLIKARWVVLSPLCNNNFFWEGRQVMDPGPRFLGGALCRGGCLPRANRMHPLPPHGTAVGPGACRSHFPPLKMAFSAPLAPLAHAGGGSYSTTPQNLTSRGGGRKCPIPLPAHTPTRGVRPSFKKKPSPKPLQDHGAVPHATVTCMDLTVIGRRHRLEFCAAPGMSHMYSLSQSIQQHWNHSMLFCGLSHSRNLYRIIWDSSITSATSCLQWSRGSCDPPSRQDSPGTASHMWREKSTAHLAM